ncbi:uncharacterized protein FA14DRAFT_181855 [Meira miltonrushii]|uniref:T6SS Phospholipase effector Tle1-like catalytic domain-containing protein n=1 Tax=Meira miltonrushii TaxID=1280837 RepID=A0A316V6V6_9BASI|nr:uncharacterized protein FA14DRAFT_181855 [Meira miltonrushii]PWN31933.1 hypothetical protein FA14DRAFT_181855 [Meira miltonrushii]
MTTVQDPLPEGHDNVHVPYTRRAPQRIIILCDGTWQKRGAVDSVFTSTGISTATNTTWFTNVALLSQCILPNAAVTDSDAPPMPQTVFYQDGIGATPYIFQRLFEGATGTSLDLKVMEAYSFIVDNYQEGDELFFFGFSRGAYTARTLAAFVNYIGILSKQERSTSLNTLWHAFNNRNPSDPSTITKAEETVFQELNRWPSANAMFSAMNNSKIQLASIPDAKDEQKADESMEQTVDPSIVQPATIPIQAEYVESEEAIIKRSPQILPPKIEIVGV